MIDVGIKLAVLTPTRRLVSPIWAQAIRNLKVPLDTEFFIDQSFQIDTSRNALVRKALDINAERLLFLDDDVVPEQNTYFELAKLQDDLCKTSLKVNGVPELGPVVSGLYYTKRRSPTRQELEPYPAAALLDQHGSIPLQIDNNVAFIECDVLGAGCLLIQSEVLRKLKEPWFKFVQSTINGAPFEISEDHYFCISCTKVLGIRPVVSTRIRCDHIANASVLRGKDGKLVF